MHIFTLIACLLILSPACEAACNKEKYDHMVIEYNLLSKHVEDSYKKGLFVKDSYDNFKSTLSIMKDYINTYLQAIKMPNTSEAPDETQCDSMEMQVDDVISGLRRMLKVEMPEQEVPIAPLAPSKEARGPSPQQSLPKNIVPSPSKPYVDTPQQSVMTDTPLTPSMPKQKEPQASTPTY